MPVPVSFPAVTGRGLTVTIATVDPRTTVDRRSGESVVLPVAIAELGVPGYTAPAAAGHVRQPAASTTA